MIVQILLCLVLNVEFIRCSATDMSTLTNSALSTTETLPASTVSDHTSGSTSIIVESTSRDTSNSAPTSTVITNGPTGGSSSIQPDSSTIAIVSTASVTSSQQSAAATNSPGQTDGPTMATGGTAAGSSTIPPATGQVGTNSPATGDSTMQPATGQPETSSSVSGGSTMQPATGQPGTNLPVSGGSTMQPATGQPGTNLPVSGGSTIQPATGQPGTNLPVSGGSTIQPATRQTTMNPAGTGMSTTQTVSTTQQLPYSYRLTFRFGIRSSANLTLGFFNSSNILDSVALLVRSSFANLLSYFTITVLGIEIRLKGRTNDYELYTYNQYQTSVTNCSRTCIRNTMSNSTPTVTIKLPTGDNTFVDVTSISSPTYIEDAATVAPPTNYPSGDSPPGVGARVGMGLGISFFVIIVVVEVVILARKYGLRNTGRQAQYNMTSF